MATCIRAVAALGADGAAPGGAARANSAGAGAVGACAGGALIKGSPPPLAPRHGHHAGDGLFACFSGGGAGPAHDAPGGRPVKGGLHLAPRCDHATTTGGGLFACFSSGGTGPAHDSALSLSASAASAALAALVAAGPPPSKPAAHGPGAALAAAAAARRFARAARRRAAAALGRGARRSAAAAAALGRGGRRSSAGGGARGGAPAKKLRPLCLVTGNPIPDFGVDGVFDVLHLLGEGGSAATYLVRDNASADVRAAKFFDRPLPKVAVPLMLVRWAGL
jgi:hypothetical protein